ncbi:MAG: hypothetical protein ACFCUN_03875 [Hyphomicrobiaceae bacterium]
MSLKATLVSAILLAGFSAAPAAAQSLPSLGLISAGAGTHSLVQDVQYRRPGTRPGPVRGFACYAVARRAGGRGARIPGIDGFARGPGACRVALNRCDRELRFLQRRGGAPFAACVIERRS